MLPTNGRQFVVMMLGTMASGKSSFSRQLAEKTGARRINADVIRRELFKIYEEWIKPAHREQVFEVLNRQARQALEAGHSVVRDYQHDSRRERDQVRRTADEFGALPIIVWLKIPAEVAVGRAIIRPESPDSVKFDEPFIRDAVKRHLERLEPPASDEPHLVIDGRWPFERQYDAFTAFWAGRL